MGEVTETKQAFSIACHIEDLVEYSVETTYFIGIITIVLFIGLNIIGAFNAPHYTLPYTIDVINIDPLDPYYFIKLFLSVFIYPTFPRLLIGVILIYLFGRYVEVGLGSLRLLAIYILSGIVGLYAQSLYNMLFTEPLLLGVVITGSIGGASGLVGAYLSLYSGVGYCKCWKTFVKLKCLILNKHVYIILWLLLIIIEPYISPLFFKSPNLINGLAGFITGYVLAKIMLNRKKIKELRRVLQTKFNYLVKPYRQTYIDKTIIIAIAITIMAISIISLAYSIMINNNYVGVYYIYNTSVTYYPIRGSVIGRIKEEKVFYGFNVKLQEAPLKTILIHNRTSHTTISGITHVNYILEDLKMSEHLINLYLKILIPSIILTMIGVLAIYITLSEKRITTKRIL
ncbi:MAG: rhomboid family intramembrane serine protease [Desulfurococcales archaeon]|nr:rhomboid family intramembrane serine protease [Desulfurococcales archaeon]